VRQPPCSTAGALAGADGDFRPCFREQAPAGLHPALLNGSQDRRGRARCKAQTGRTCRHELIEKPMSMASGQSASVKSAVDQTPAEVEERGGMGDLSNAHQTALGPPSFGPVWSFWRFLIRWG